MFSKMPLLIVPLAQDCSVVVDPKNFEPPMTDPYFSFFSQPMEPALPPPLPLRSSFSFDDIRSQFKESDGLDNILESFNENISNEMASFRAQFIDTKQIYSPTVFKFSKKHIHISNGMKPSLPPEDWYDDVPCSLLPFKILLQLKLFDAFKASNLAFPLIRLIMDYSIVQEECDAKPNNKRSLTF